jgi:hypothetical protein
MWSRPAQAESCGISLATISGVGPLLSLDVLQREVGGATHALMTLVRRLIVGPSFLRKTIRDVELPPSAGT